MFYLLLKSLQLNALYDCTPYAFTALAYSITFQKEIPLLYFCLDSASRRLCQVNNRPVLHPAS